MVQKNLTKVEQYKRKIRAKYLNDIRSGERSRVASGESGQEFWRTPLRFYGHPIGLNVELWLEEKALQARRKGKPLRVLDVGVGEGSQWLAFLEKHPDVDFEATAMARDTVHPALRSRTHVATADRLDRVFSNREPFDVVVSHLGMHDQEHAGLQRIFELLRPGGEAVVTGGINASVPELPRLIDPAGGRVQLLRFKNTSTSFGGIHFKKLVSPGGSKKSVR